MFNPSRLLSVVVAAMLVAACSGGGTASTGSSNSSTSTASTQTAQNAGLAVMVSDAASEDWATIGVRILSIALIPQGGGGHVTVYTASSAAPFTNLVMLDQLDELIGNATIPVGTYTGAVLTVGGNPSDILLTTASSPETGFAAPASTTIPSSQIQVQHTQGSGANLTVPVTVNFDSPLVVNASETNALDLEFNLAHPAFLIEHVPEGSGPTIWTVNFDGPVRRIPRRDLTRLVLRHTYGEVMSISSDNSSITITKEFPVEPPTNPETAIAGTAQPTITADAVNGTLLYDLDAKTKSVIENFSSEMSLVGKYVRIAARYQENGTLVAVRIWASSEFNDVWVSPEGHVLHVNDSTDVVWIENESGHGIPLTVNVDTQFFFRDPQNGADDSKPIGTGPAFLSSKDLVRGFKVHASVVDPLATPLVAQSIDIETAVYDGTISAPDMTGFTYTKKFVDVNDDYVHTLDYVSSETANGTDDSGNAISGYKWWDFAYPTLLTDGSNAINEFISATNGSVNFGGTVGTVPSYGVSYAIWKDPADSAGWAAYASVLTPAKLPLATVALGLMNNAFSVMVAGGTDAVTVDVSTTTGSATLVYQVDRTNGIVTVSPIDITSSAGLADLKAGLAVGAPVKVYAIPQAGGTLKAYVIAYFTGEMPSE